MSEKNHAEVNEKHSIIVPTPVVQPKPAPTLHYDTFKFSATGAQTAKIDAISTKEGPEQLVGFKTGAGDVLNLANILKASPATLATLTNYITATTNAAGDTTLSYDATGTGLVGTAFAVLKGITVTVAQLLADNALSLGSVPSVVVPAVLHTDVVTFATAGNQTIRVDAISAKEGTEQLIGFKTGAGDVLNLANVVKGSTATLATLGGFVTASTSVAGDTTLYFDATGTGLTGTAFAVLKGVSVTVAQLLADNALSLTGGTVATLPGAHHVDLLQNNGVLHSGDGNYLVNATGAHETISLGKGDNHVFSQQGNTTVTLGNGHAEIFLNGTNNTITVGDNTSNGVSEIIAGSGQEHVTTGNGNVYIVGSGDHDVITVGNGNDTIIETGHAGAAIGFNTVTLGLGNDMVFLGGTGNTVLMGAGVDRIYGGTGNDTFSVNSAGGTDTISNFTLTNGDVLDVSKILAGASLAHDLSNLSSFITTSSIIDSAVSSGYDTKLVITGSTGTANVTLMNTGSIGLNDLVSHNSLGLPVH
jgi:Ca2+-binding RTX toxin-like protein